MEIGENTEVTLQFSIKDQKGEVLNDIYEYTPYRFVFDEAPKDQYPGLEKGVKGMAPGQTRMFTVPAKSAFGERDKSLVERIRSDELPKGSVAVGNMVRKLSETGKASKPYTVTGFIGDWVYLDQNHPWAGKDLYYTVRIMAVAPVPEKKDKVTPIRQ